jgi:competence protein ComEC
MTRPPVSTPAGWKLVVVCGAFCAAVSAGMALHPSLLMMGAWAACTVGAAAVATAARHARPMLVLLVGAACAAGLLRAAVVPAADAAWIAALHGGPAKLVGTVREGTGSRRAAAQVVVDVDRLVHADGDAPVHAGVLATLRTGPAVLPGDRVEIDAAGLRPVGGDGAEAVLAREGVDAVAQSPTLALQDRGRPSPQRLLAVVRTRLAGLVDAALSEPTSSLLDGIAFGIPRPLPADLTAAMRDSGLAHILAVSGLKVVLVAGLVAALCGALALSPRARLLLTAAVVGGYVCLAGAGPAAVRSAVMAGVGWGLQGTGRSPDPLPLLAAVGAAMLAVDPGLCHDVGFQLSFLGTAGIVLLAAPLARRLPGPRLLREPFAMTLAAQVVTLPVMASTFGVVSLVGPTANALAVPLLPPLIVSGALGAALAAAVPIFGFLPLQVAGGLTSLVAWIARLAARAPGAAFHVSTWPPQLVGAELAAVLSAGLVWLRYARRRPVGTAVLALRRVGAAPSARPPLPAHARRRPTSPDVAAQPPRLSRRAAIAASCVAALVSGGVVVVAASRPDGRMHVAVLDVGASRAVLVQTSTGGRALVDTGSDPQRLLQSLGSALPPLTRGIGLLVLTGGDRSAVGGLPGLVSRYAVDRAVVPATGLGSTVRAALADLRDRGTAVELTATDVAWAWGDATWRLLTPDGDIADGAALRVTEPTGRALLLGSLPTAAQEELAALHPNAVATDLLVAPTGGAVAAALADVARPRLLAIPDARSSRAPTSTPLLSGPAVRRTSTAGTLTYTGSQGGLVAP